MKLNRILSIAVVVLSFALGYALVATQQSQEPRVPFLRTTNQVVTEIIPIKGGTDSDLVFVSARDEDGAETTVPIVTGGPMATCSLAEVKPGLKPGFYPNAAGQIFRFIHEAKEGDLVVYPSKRDRLMHIGEIAGPYQYDAKPDPEYPQHRAVKWLKYIK